MRKKNKFELKAERPPRGLMRQVPSQARGQKGGGAEIYKRKNGKSFWQGADAEGRRY